MLSVNTKDPYIVRVFCILFYLYPSACSENNLAYSPFSFSNSSCAPCSRTVPLSITIILSAFLTVENLCEIIITVIVSGSFSNCSKIFASASASIAEVGSSNIHNGALR